MSSHDKLTVLVTGATGQQGGALSEVLLHRGHGVRAFTRNPESPAAQKLKAFGAEIFTGNFDDGSSLEKAVQGTDAVFAMGTPYEAGTEVEMRQSLAVINAVASVGTNHLVYTSVGSADKNTGIPHFDNKFEVEKHIKSLRLPYTIIAPVYFMDNLFFPDNLKALRNGSYALALPEGRKLQQIALTDVGFFNAHVLEHRDEFLGRRIDIASDEFSGTEAAEILSSLNGRKFNFFEVPVEQVREQSEDLALMYEWFDRVGYSADIQSLRRDYPQIGWHSFDKWAKKQDWSSLS